MRADVLNRKVVEFANLMATGKSGPESMDIGRFESKTKWADQLDEWGEDDGFDEEVIQLSAVGTTCHKCGGLGCYASECPSKGSGKKAVAKAKAKAAKAAKAREKASEAKALEKMAKDRMAKDKVRDQ